MTPWQTHDLGPSPPTHTNTHIHTHTYTHIHDHTHLDALDLLLGPYQLPLQVLHLVLDVLLLWFDFICLGSFDLVGPGM
jgi:hypothetical protein